MKLTEEHIQFILDQIESWSVKDGILKVPALLDRLQAKYGDKPTDRSIRNYLRITQRIAERKEELRTGVPVSQQSNKKPSSLSHAAQRIEALEREVQRLEEDNARLIHQFVVWQRNATNRGMTEAQLNNPLVSDHFDEEDG